MHSAKIYFFLQKLNTGVYSGTNELKSNSLECLMPSNHKQHSLNKVQSKMNVCINSSPLIVVQDFNNEFKNML